MAETLAPLTYGKIVGRITALVADTAADPDKYPDVVPLSGTVTFTPSATVVTVETAVPVPTTVVLTPITATLDTDGYINNPTDGVWVLATNDTSINPSGFTWQVSFAVKLGTTSLPIPGFNFTVPSGTTVDISELLPTNANPGVISVAAPVTSVNSKTGAVSLVSTDLPDLTERIQDVVGAMLGAGSNVVVTYNDTAGTIAISSTSSGGTGLDAEAVRDAIGVALVGVGNIAVTVNDAADTITITTTATVNSTDAALRARASHTGTQLSATISDFNTAVDARVTAMLAAYGVRPTIYYTTTTQARTVPAGYTGGKEIWDSADNVGIGDPVNAIDGDRVEDRPVA